jgi:GNAT superfamily N-acetyltransferase
MPVACVALRMQSGKSAKVKRLAVLPESQGLGFGQQLVAHAESVARRRSCVAVEIGIIAGHAALLDWYRRQGYVETHQAVFPQLPFTVQYMTKGLTADLV